MTAMHPLIQFMANWSTDKNTPGDILHSTVRDLEIKIQSVQNALAKAASLSAAHAAATVSSKLQQNWSIPTYPVSNASFFVTTPIWSQMRVQVEIQIVGLE